MTATMTDALVDTAAGTAVGVAGLKASHETVSGLLAMVPALGTYAFMRYMRTRNAS